MASWMLNDELNKFFADEVQLRRSRTKKVIEKVKPEIDEILGAIRDLDPHYSRAADAIGSYYQGLKVQQADEFDYSIPFDIGTNLTWGPGKQMNFGFNVPDQNDTNTLRDDLRIVPSYLALQSPGTDYISCTLNDAHQRSQNLYEFTYQEFLIPFLARRKFRQLLLHVLKNQGAKGPKLDRLAHGPALTLTIDVRDGSETIPVSVDFSVVIHARLPFTESIGWPRRQALWPPKEKIDMIKEKGINMVAKKNFHWMLSFAELEKLLVHDMDKDGGCRKMVHRIMKTILHKHFSNGKGPLTSYMLKNAWLWECQDNPYTASWTRQRLSERFIGCVRRLQAFAISGNLPQYFYPAVNVFKGTDMNVIRQTIDQVYGGWMRI